MKPKHPTTRHHPSKTRRATNTTAPGTLPTTRKRQPHQGAHGCGLHAPRPPRGRGRGHQHGGGHAGVRRNRPCPGGQGGGCPVGGHPVGAEGHPRPARTGGEGGLSGTWRTGRTCTPPASPATCTASARQARRAATPAAGRRLWTLSEERPPAGGHAVLRRTLTGTGRRLGLPQPAGAGEHALQRPPADGRAGRRHRRPGDAPPARRRTRPGPLGEPAAHRQPGRAPTAHLHRPRRPGVRRTGRALRPGPWRSVGHLAVRHGAAGCWTPAAVALPG
ncbi:hypothetical protein BX285_7032 [Streptomyces sp. 1114.5]|nr:hypothetical protein BX285_7032 [Streptomyces sp. 1114.5]